MTREELFRRNQQLSTEFELYLFEHPEIEEKIPDNAMIVLLPGGRGDVGSETTYDMGLLGADSASCFRTYVPYPWMTLIPSQVRE